MTSSTNPSDDFVLLLTEHQSQLMGYILAALGDHTNAADVLQQTNLVLWQKSAELRSSDEFMPWAITVAKYKVLSFVRDKSRGKLFFSSEVTEAMLDVVEEGLDELPQRQLALRECLKELPESRVQLLLGRYCENTNLTQIAEQAGMSVDAIKGRLVRIRKWLANCIEHRIASWSGSLE